MSLKNKHPNLFLAYLVNGFINVAVGLFSLFSTELTVISYAFIGIYILVGLAIIATTLKYNPTLVRVSLITGLFYNSFFVFLFLVGLVIDFDTGRNTAYTIPLFLAHAIATFLIAIEPPINPATMKEESNGS